MKNTTGIFLFVIVFGSLASAYCTAQDSASAGARNELQLKVGFTVLNPAVPYGLGYKLHFKKSALRIGVTYTYSSNVNNGSQLTEPLTYTFYYNGYSTGTTNINETPVSLTTSFSVGYEWESNFNKVQLFYGVDFLYNYSKTETKTTSYGDTINIITSHNQTTTTGNGYGISPFFGAKYRISKRFSVSAQANINNIYTMQKSDNAYWSLLSPVTPTLTSISGEVIQKSNLFASTIYPVGNIAINFHF